MNRYPRRLIEVDLPIRRISAHARREKSIRHGHISTLHIWWARRPLAACRAVILAALWPDPAPGPDDPPCPRAFLDAARNSMIAWAQKHPEKASKESFDRINAIRTNPAIVTEKPLELRNALLDFIADFANWDNSTDKDFLETSRALVQAAHEALGGLPGTRPLVVDPFAGGGSIPLEALRVGADAFASDLNPVAVLLNKVVLEYIPKYGQRLADEVRTWGEWIRQEAEKELAEFYPKDPDGATPIAYLWARTITCEGPGCGAEVPLIRSLWLAKKVNRSVALQPVPRPRARRVDFKIIVRDRRGWVNQDDPKERVVDPSFDGTVKRGSATCPCCGYTTPNDRVRLQLSESNGGARTARLLVVILVKGGYEGRVYRLPKQRHRAAVASATLALEDRQGRSADRTSTIPDERVPTERPSPNARGLSAVTRMGVTTFGDLFTSRQALALAILGQKVRALQTTAAVLPGEEPQFREALTSVLSLAVGRTADNLSSLVTWAPAGEFQGHTFARQALPIVWDFAECCPLGDGPGSWTGAWEWVAKVVEAVADARVEAGAATQASATAHPLPDDAAHALITDPPYYDAVPYSDLSQYFYVWLRRILAAHPSGLFVDSTPPSDEEAIWNPSRIYAKTGRPKDERFYEHQMSVALAEGRRATAPHGIGVVVFAHQSTAGWEAVLSALLGAGWVATGSWPIDTERDVRTNAMGTASLASSVHLVCRPRENPDGSLRADDVGDWRDVLSELPRRIHDWMPRLRDEGVVGADAIFACLGPALEVFSRYSRVEKASGEVVTLREYLEHVWAAVSTEALSMIFDDADAAGLEPDARLTAMWLWTLGAGKTTGAASDEDDEDEDDETSKAKKPVKGFALEFDAARKIAQGLGIHLERSSGIVEVKGETARLLPVSERLPFLFGKDAPGSAGATSARRSKQRKLFAEMEADERMPAGTGIGAGLSGRAMPGQTVLDRVHQAMVLFGGNRGEALKQFLVDDRVGHDARFWTLAQSLSALYPASAEEKRWVDGVLARKKGLGF